MLRRMLSVSREWRFFLTDMIEFCEQIENYVEGFDYQQFIDSSLNYDATVRKVELLGEAARNIPEDVRQLAPDIEWPKIIRIRNILIHGYFAVDDEILWDIVSNRIGPLLASLRQLEHRLR